MRKIFAVAFALLTVMMLTVSASQAKEKQIYVIHVDTPSWVIETIGKNAKTYWFTDQYAYGVGIAPPMKNRSLQRTTAENRARAALISGLHANPTINGIVEIRDTWRNPDNGTEYALVRTSIKIVPVK